MNLSLTISHPHTSPLTMGGGGVGAHVERVGRGGIYKPPSAGGWLDAFGSQKQVPLYLTGPSLCFTVRVRIILGYYFGLTGGGEDSEVSL